MSGEHQLTVLLGSKRQIVGRCIFVSCDCCVRACRFINSTRPPLVTRYPPQSFQAGRVGACVHNADANAGRRRATDDEAAHDATQVDDDRAADACRYDGKGNDNDNDDRHYCRCGVGSCGCRSTSHYGGQVQRCDDDDCSKRSAARRFDGDHCEDSKRDCVYYARCFATICNDDGDTFDDNNNNCDCNNDADDDDDDDDDFINKYTHTCDRVSRCTSCDDCDNATNYIDNDNNIDNNRNAGYHDNDDDDIDDF